MVYLEEEERWMGKIVNSVYKFACDLHMFNFAVDYQRGTGSEFKGCTHQVI